jgi:hypothetical protein
MHSQCTYGLAALNPSSEYPSFEEGTKLLHIPCDLLLGRHVGELLLEYFCQPHPGWDRSVALTEVEAACAVETRALERARTKGVHGLRVDATNSSLRKWSSPHPDVHLLHRVRRSCPRLAWCF